MPAGAYRVMDGTGRPTGLERFRYAPGPAGWRYFSTVDTEDPEPHRESIDLVVDSAWSPVRLRVDTGSHELVLAAEGDRLSGIRDGERLEIPWHPGIDLDYLSPAFNAVTATRLETSIREGSEIEVVYAAPVTLEPTMERQRYERLGVEEADTPVGRFEARRWRFTALSSGWTRDLWLAGDLVVAFEGLFELVEYDPGPGGPGTSHTEGSPA